MRKILLYLLDCVIRNFRSRAALQLEIIVLRHQLEVLQRTRPTRVRLTRLDRTFWLFLYRLWPRCLDAVVIVKPETPYTARAITHALECGVRTIEHGNLIDKKAANLAASKGTYLVPTLVAYRAMDKAGLELGLPEVSIAKRQDVLVAGLESVEICLAAGVKLGFGSDLLGALQEHQSLEFSIRAEAQPAHDVLASATVINAEILGKEGELGVVAPGARADLIVVNGNPLENLNLLQEQGCHIPVIMKMKAGAFYKNQLN